MIDIRNIANYMSLGNKYILRSNKDSNNKRKLDIDEYENEIDQSDVDLDVYVDQYVDIQSFDVDHNIVSENDTSLIIKLSI